jgi:catechol 2,3-dioxygenase-like lactoylglutathione lyase family enzyme
MLGMPAIARLGAVSLDAADPGILARFYQDILGLEVYYESPDFVALTGASTLLTFQRVKDMAPADWPTGPIPKQMHLELSVDDLEAADKAAIAAGARRAQHQPAPDRWRVLIDPAGHPFCLSNVIPEV